MLLVDEPAPLVRRLTLNRPEKRNALNDELRGALFDALRAADSSSDVSVVIVRGGGPCFSAGYDLGSINSDVERAIAPTDGWWSRHVVNNWFEMWDMSTPIIGQVHGYCLAGGTDVALLCDMVVAADDAVFGFPPARDLGALPNNMWVYNVGPQWAKRLTLTGDTVTGAEAQVRASAIRSSMNSSRRSATPAAVEDRLVPTTSSARVFLLSVRLCSVLPSRSVRP